MASINASTSGRPTGSIYVDSLIWGGSWAPALGQGATLDVAILTGADLGARGTTTGRPWSDAAVTALHLALDLWATVADLSFVPAAPGMAADLSYILVDGREMKRLAGAGALGFHEVPDGTDGAPLTGVFSADGKGWTDAGLAQGGYGLITLIHEIGHGLGLAHPHDGGGDGQTFPGVTSPGDTGKFHLNQGIWTVMSYVDGWKTQFPDHADLTFGWEATPMALDIAAIQAIYGANKGFRTGDDTYALPTANGAGTFWSCIWDAGGRDSLSAAGATGDAVLDLRAAPLTGKNAGGYVSSVKGVVGGVTIANGVVIENATGGDGNDVITGNAAANMLRGGAGADTINGGRGNDTLDGDGGADVLTGGAGRDSFLFDSLPTDRTLADRITDFTPGEDRILLDHLAFSGLAAGALDAGAFALGRRAAEADDRLLYDATSGLLRWDADGAGGAAPVVVASIGASLALDATSFWIL